MTPKSARHRSILEVIERSAIASQEELRQELEHKGLRVTQATLSRDLRELGIVRSPTPNGPRYVQPESVLDDDKPSLDGLLPQLFASVDGVRELLVLRTLPSGAQPIAEAIDAMGWDEILGTIGGENTILIVCRSEGDRLEVAKRLIELAEKP